MSIENSLKKSADALERIATAMEALVNQGAGIPAANVNTPVETPAPAPVAPQPPAAAAPPVPPAPPTPAATTPAPPPTPAPTPDVQLPFADINGLVQYVMGKYQSLGAEKGDGIQNVLVGLGYSNINDVQPEHFAQFYTQVEAIQ